VIGDRSNTMDYGVLSRPTMRKGYAVLLKGQGQGHGGIKIDRERKCRVPVTRNELV
jgi:hypothetical protein